MEKNIIINGKVQMRLKNEFAKVLTRYRNGEFRREAEVEYRKEKIRTALRQSSLSGKIRLVGEAVAKSWHRFANDSVRLYLAHIAIAMLVIYAVGAFYWNDAFAASENLSMFKVGNDLSIALTFKMFLLGVWLNIPLGYWYNFLVLDGELDGSKRQAALRNILVCLSVATFFFMAWRGMAACETETASAMRELDNNIILFVGYLFLTAIEALISVLIAAFLIFLRALPQIYG